MPSEGVIYQWSVVASEIKQLQSRRSGKSLPTHCRHSHPLSLQISKFYFLKLTFEQNIVEGVYHTGLGAVVQAIASKAV